MDLLSDMSVTEKKLWAELFVDIVVALYYFPKMFVLIRTGDTVLSAEMAALVVRTIIVAIVVGIAVSVLLRVWQESQRPDERDIQFSARGTLIANGALVAFVVLIMGQLVVEGLFPGLAGKLGVTAKPLIIAHLLLLSLLFSSVIKAVAQLFLYRRGF